MISSGGPNAVEVEVEVEEAAPVSHSGNFSAVGNVLVSQHTRVLTS